MTQPACVGLRTPPMLFPPLLWLPPYLRNSQSVDGATNALGPPLSKPRDMMISLNLHKDRLGQAWVKEFES
jgi:hypothetical protein